MAINPSTDATMAGRITPADADFPYGSSKNETAPGAGDGSPYFKARADDIFGLQQWLLTVAGIVPTGTADNVNASQYGDALRAIFGNVGLTVMTAGGTYNPPDNAKALLVVAIAGGGAGGSCNAPGGGQSIAAPGGGAGGCAIGLLTNLEPSYSVGVGPGGAASPGSFGGAGGPSGFFGGPTSLSALGGSGGQAGAATSGSLGRDGGSGGSATGGDLNFQGGNGSAAWIRDGTPVMQGVGGGNIFSPSTPLAVALADSAFGFDGRFPGGGGCGASSFSPAVDGGGGAPGVVIIVEFFQL